MKKFLNYVGQLRLYSFFDLVLLLLAARAEQNLFIGSILLWIGFLAYLETSHHHTYREKIPRGAWQITAILGLFLYGKIEGLLFVGVSYFYTLKNKKGFGLYAPVFRGLQYFFLLGGIIGYRENLTWLALILIIIRNTLADFRDIQKDRNEHMRTFPITLGFKKDLKYLHILFLLFTTFVWWNFANIGFQYLLIIWIIQILTYNLTPR